MKSISILSGKGGAGKTTLASNLSAVFSEKFGSTVLLDADFGLPNSHILLNCKPKNTLLDLLKNDRTIDQLLTPITPTLSMISGFSGSEELLNLNDNSLTKIFNSFKNIGETFDYLILDNAAGADKNTLTLAAAASNVVVVLVNQPTNFLDAYSTIKAAHAEFGINEFNILVNMSLNFEEGNETFARFSKIVTRFLEVELKFVGTMVKSPKIETSIANRKLFSLEPDSKETQSLIKIAQTIYDTQPASGAGLSF